MGGKHPATPSLTPTLAPLRTGRTVHAAGRVGGEDPWEEGARTGLVGDWGPLDGTRGRFRSPGRGTGGGLGAPGRDTRGVWGPLDET